MKSELRTNAALLEQSVLRFKPLLTGLQKYPDFQKQAKEAEAETDTVSCVAQNLNRLADLEENPPRPKAKKGLKGGTEPKSYQIPGGND